MQNISQHLRNCLGFFLGFKSNSILFFQNLSQANPSEIYKTVEKYTRRYKPWIISFLIAVISANTASLFLDGLIPDAPTIPVLTFKPKTETQKSLTAYSPVLTRNLFSSKNLIPEDAENGVAVRTSLPLKLLGTVVAFEEIKSLATIEDSSVNQVFPVRVLDTILEKARITKIEHRRVYFINQQNGQAEYVELPLDDFDSSSFIAKKNVRSLRPDALSAVQKDSGINQISETQFEVNRSVLDSALHNLEKTLSEARAIPNYENGVADGYRLVQITPGSLYEKIGLKTGDIICGVDGESINDPAKAIQVMNQFKTMSNLGLCVKRGGKTSVMNYDIR